MYHISLHFILTNIAQLINIDIILNQHITITGLLIYNKIKRNWWSAIAESFTLQKIINQTKDNDKMSSESNSANQEPVSNIKQKVIKKGFTNNWISKSQVFCKIFTSTSVKKEEYKYNNKYYVLDTEELNENIKIKNYNTIVSSISRDI